MALYQAKSQNNLDSLLKKYNIIANKSLPDTCQNVYHKHKVNLTLCSQLGNICTPLNSTVVFKGVITNSDTKNIFIIKDFDYSLGNKNTPWTIDVIYGDTIKLIDSNTETMSSSFKYPPRKYFIKLKPNESTEFTFSIDFSKLKYYRGHKNKLIFLKEVFYGKYKIYLHYYFGAGKDKFCLCADSNGVEVEYKED